jgi:hypothetical protein
MASAVYPNVYQVLALDSIKPQSQIRKMAESGEKG